MAAIKERVNFAFVMERSGSGGIEESLVQDSLEALCCVLEQDIFIFLVRVQHKNLCLLKIAEPVCEHIFERIKHRIGIVLASEYTLLSYLNVSSVIP